MKQPAELSPYGLPPSPCCPFRQRPETPEGREACLSVLRSTQTSFNGFYHHIRKTRVHLWIIGVEGTSVKIIASVRGQIGGVDAHDANCFGCRSRSGRGG